MKALVQRVSSAEVNVEGVTTGSIKGGLLVFVGFRNEDSTDDLHWMAEKLTGLRIFPDENSHMNRSLIDTGGEMLIVSQFTLHADTRKGKRPSFVKAAAPDTAEILYRLFIEMVRERGIPVSEGVFGAMMKVSLVNDGPVTVMVDSPSERHV
jgi:D-tyrosyl-tRNA(Tyr) deacylase